MKLLLVAIHPYPSPQAVPLANAFLKSYLKSDRNLDDKVSTVLLDFFVGEPRENAISTILMHDPEAVGFSVYLWNREMSCELAKALRRLKPHITIFAGGPEPTADPGGLLAEAPFDFLVLGEGEETVAEAISSLAAGTGIAGTEGTAYIESGTIKVSRPRQLEQLDNIPSPFLSGAIDPAGYGGFLWQLSRGCGFSCDYCFDSQEMRGVRRFSLERVRAELDFLVENNVAQVFVIDSTFNQDKKRAKEILRLIGRRAPHVHFHFEVRSEFIDAEMADLFARVNCSLQLGLQSADPRVQGMVSRNFNPDQFRKKIGLLNRSGAIFGFDLIYGLPGDTLAGFFTSVDFALALYPNHLDIFPLAVLPGTALAAKADAHGLRRLASPPYTLQSSPGFPPGSMEKAKSLAMACDIFYSRGKAVAWFNSILSPLKMSPSSFLCKFREWLRNAHGEVISESVLADEDVRQLQREFIKNIYNERNLGKLLPTALDLVDYHWCYAAALLAVAPELPPAGRDDSLNLLEEPLLLSPGASLASFNHDILNILDAGEIDLRSFSKRCSPTGSHAVIYPLMGEVRTYLLSKTQFELLSRLDGLTPPRAIAASLRLSQKEARSLLKYCIRHGIIRHRLRHLAE